MYDKLNLIELAKNRMDWVAQRQAVLAENIANANTPKYTPSDITAFKGELNKLLPVQPVVTQAGHIATQVTDPRVTVRTKKTFESSPDGNAVVLDEQMAKLSESKTAYELAAGLFQKQFKFIKTALGKGF